MLHLPHVKFVSLKNDGFKKKKKKKSLILVGSRGSLVAKHIHILGQCWNNFATHNFH